jgi:hypothetical protein
MDKSVKRVTVIEGASDKRHAKVVYEGQKADDESEIPPMERAVRHIVNAALISAQVAYDTYVQRASKGKTPWLFQPGAEGTGTAPHHDKDPDIGDDRGTFGTKFD